MPVGVPIPKRHATLIHPVMDALIIHHSAI